MVKPVHVGFATSFLFVDGFRKFDDRIDSGTFALSRNETFGRQRGGVIWWESHDAADRSIPIDAVRGGHLGCSGRISTVVCVGNGTATAIGRVIVRGRGRIKTKHAVFHGFGLPCHPSLLQKRRRYVFWVGMGGPEADEENVESNNDKNASEHNAKDLSALERDEKRSMGYFRLTMPGGTLVLEPSSLALGSRGIRMLMGDRVTQVQFPQIHSSGVRN